MRRLELLISQSRLDTDNSDFSEGRGIQDSQFIDWANNAQDRLQSVIVGVHATAFKATTDIDCVVQQEAYDVPTDTYQGSLIHKVRFSPNGEERQFFPLTQGGDLDRMPGAFGRPSVYVIEDKKLLLARIPDSAGKLRVTYSRQLPRLDIRRGKVTSVVVVGTSVSDLTMDPVTMDQEGIDYIVEVGYICIVDKDGRRKAIEIPVTAIDAVTGVVAIEAGYELGAGETIAAGHFMVAGPNSTTHSELPDNCERYLIAAMNMKAERKDTSSNTSAWKDERDEIEGDIKASFAEADQDVDYVPVIDPDFLDCY